MQRSLWQKLVCALGFVPIAEFDDERCRHGDEIDRWKDRAAQIHAAGIQREKELEKQVADLRREGIVARSEVEGDHYARELFNEIFPGIACPDRLDEVMEKIHLFMTSQTTEIKDCREKCLSFVEMADHIDEILGHVREMSGNKENPPCNPTHPPVAPFKIGKPFPPDFSNN